MVYYILVCTYVYSESILPDFSFIGLAWVDYIIRYIHVHSIGRINDQYIYIYNLRMVPFPMRIILLIIIYTWYLLMDIMFYKSQQTSLPLPGSIINVK